jgi:WD40-like Beta Propeller Repeat
LTEWKAGGAAIGAVSGLWLSASSDGQRVVLKNDMSHSDIYVARFDERQGRLLDLPRRLTSDERGSFPGAWTPDGDTILFNLGQSGSQDVFTQRLNAESAEPLVVGPGNQVLPRISSDGRWVFFLTLPATTERFRIMRVPLAGGRPEQVFDTAGVAFPRCALRSRCVLYEVDKDHWTISSFDPVRGKGERLGSIPVGMGEDLSPDGNAVAVLVIRPSNRIRIYSLKGELQKVVEGRAPEGSRGR